MISAAHMIGGHATLREIFKKMCNFMRLGEYFIRFCIKENFLKSSLCIEQCYLRELTTATTEYDIC